MYEYKTNEGILQAMLSNLDEDIDKREGSLAHDLLMPAAIELTNAYYELDNVLILGFADTTTGKYLDMRASEVGLSRKGSTKATGYVQFTGTNGTYIPIGTRVQTSNEFYFLTIEEAFITGGTASVLTEAEFGGTASNVGANTIRSLSRGDLSGVLRVNNLASFEGGSDYETDEALLMRIQQKIRKPVTSGNVNHYEQWATEIAGIGFAKVYPVWNGGGTVKVVLLGEDKNPPTQPIVNQATAHIESNKPIGVDVTVIPAVRKPITVEITPTLTTGYTKEQAQIEFTQLVNSYLETIAFKSPSIIYNKISSLVFDTNSMVDYTSLTVNGLTTNIVLSEDETPVLSGVVVT